VGWLETQARGMEKQASEAEPAQKAIPCLVPVFVVTGHRHPDVSGVHPDLMRASGNELRLHEGKVSEPLQSPEDGARRLALTRIDPHHALPALQGVLAQRRVDRELPLGQSARKQSDVVLFDGPLAHQSVQLT